MKRSYRNPGQLYGGTANRNSAQLIVPNQGDYLECEECGMCIDICPVGALTSGPYRYSDCQAGSTAVDSG